MIRGLIVSGDDLGLHEAINRGVIDAHENGIVTSASIVPCGRAFDDACRLAARTDSLDLGVHLTLVEEKPLLSSIILNSLAPEGQLPRTYRQLFMGLIKGHIDLIEIEKELEAQVARVLDAGLKVSHLDSHQHTHFFPPLRKVFLNLAERHGIKGIRASRRIVPGATKFSLLLQPLARGFARAARSRGLGTPDVLWLPSPSGHVTVSQLVKGLPKLPEGITEVVVHPGIDQKALARAYPGWGFKWEQELSALKAIDVRDALTKNHVRLTRYSELH
jgi:predicted glycoside hydrolase/deacetylase ChbG (UPF0249 family)